MVTPVALTKLRRLAEALIEGEQCCVLWIPVDPVTASNGGMRYVRGSHVGGALSAPNLFVTNARMPGSEGELLPDIEAIPEAYDIVSFTQSRATSSSTITKRSTARAVI